MRRLAGLLLWLLSSPLAASEILRVVVFAGGVGQAVLLARGDSGILVDVGYADTAAAIVDRVRALGVRRLDHLVLTHLHPDHAGGYFHLRRAFTQALVLDSGYPEPQDISTDAVREVVRALAAEPKRRILRAGDTWDWRDAHLRVLWPPRMGELPARGGNLNRNSLVLEIVFGRGRALLMGDADRLVERTLLDGALSKGPVFVLVAGHHGADDTGLGDFLRHLAPMYAVVPVDGGNTHGYPSRETLDRLSDASRVVRRTDRDGEVCIQWERRGAAPSVCESDF